MPSRPGRPRGQSVVELALILPVMLLLLAAAIDLGRLFYSYVAVENAAKEGAFFGSRNPLCDDGTNANCQNPNNVIWHVQNEAPNIGSQFTTTVACRDLANTLVAPINNCLDGFKYQVTVTYPFRLVTPIIGNLLGDTLTLHSEAQATVVNDAFDPSGLETLVWVNTTNSENGAAIVGACTQADPVTSPGFYYQPCQDSTNVDNYLTFQENATISYKVRVRNTGNTNLTGIGYTFTINGSNVSAPGTCGSLPTSIVKAAAPSFCTFTRTAGFSGTGDFPVTITANGDAGGLSTGDTNGVALVKVIPAPRFTVNLKASSYRLGDDGDGVLGAPSYPVGDITLNRDAAGIPEVVNPTGWLRLTVVNTGGPANNFAASVTQGGSNVLPASCNVPATLGASGDPDDTFTCTFPRTVATNQTFVANVSATNSIVAGGDPNVTISTGTCNPGKKVVPNLVDTLTPTPDGSNKTVGQAKAMWPAAGFSGTVTTNPVGAPNTDMSITQNQVAYSCQNTNTNVTIGAQP